MIVGGLYSVTALRENDQERVTLYTKHQLKLHSQTTLTNDGGLKNLDTRGDGSRIGEIVLHVGGNAVAPEGVLRHVHPLGDSPRRCLADGGVCQKHCPRRNLKASSLGSSLLCRWNQRVVRR